MPSRLSTRTSTTSHLARKSSNQTLASRRTTASRVSSPTIVVPDEGPFSVLRSQICSIFSDAQRNTAGHRKLAVSLRKIQEACCYEPTNFNSNSGENCGENDFNVEMARCAIRLMGVKKSEGVGDRVVKFLGFFLKYASDKDISLISDDDMEETQSFPETPTSRLVAHILSIMLPLMTSKEKTVRYRSTQLVAHMINSLDSIDDEYFHLLKIALMKRIRDKEPMVRVQAVLGLGRLAGNEDGEAQEDADSDNDEASGLLVKLLEVLQNDASADVRRSLLLNLPLIPGTLPYLLERARDLDSATRRTLYSRLLPALGDFRHLSLSMREKLLRWGLRDRDENVRKAAARLFRERWIEDCAGPYTATEDVQAAKEASPPSIEGLLELLERIDVVNSAVDGGVASEAMKEFWSGRPDYREEVTFTDEFWGALTPERVFMARSFNDFCRQEDGRKCETLVEEKMPEVTKLAFFVQQYTNNLVDSLRRNNAKGEDEDEQDTVEQEFIVEQLLHIAKNLDYSDEVGRRKTFDLLRETLAIAELPDEITKLVIDVLRDVCGDHNAGEREFCGIVLEAIAEVHDNIAVEELMGDNEDESFHSARSEMSENTPINHRARKPMITDVRTTGDEDEAKAINEIMINMKCLHIAQCMLQNIQGNLQQNVHLVALLNNLVVPAVRSHEAPIRERGLLCLGLCCFLDKNLAEENLTLFIHCYTKGHDALQVTAIHVLSDILTTHPNLLAASEDSALEKSIYKIFTKALKAVHTPEVQSAATIALCKAMLTSVIQDEDLLKQAVICYFDPGTKDNAAVRQALSYFLPVYCHSKRENMERMAVVAPGIVHTMVNLGEEIDEEAEMVGISVVSTMLVDWTDARKLVVQDEASISWNEAGQKEIKAVNGDIHLVLAEALLERAMSNSCSREEKKALIMMLGKLYITPTSDGEKLQVVQDLTAEAIDIKIATDAASRSALNRLHATLVKAIGDSAVAGKKIEEERAVQDELMVVGQHSPPELTEIGDDSVINDVKRESRTEAGDTLLEELLDDEEEL
ncbi:MAG: hypothetical protein HETSPECPRED_002915 [Heterodermia speciosa]|uniref:Nuclear condensin complex subunit 3 C-terminal domain-containing protein n=1 Tax=Heterodermia speciosa TaxID=116794 RepID=A0A8H3F3Q0_9LECA|nr:MAG: hypothetical protein HETSPECPRED_002915 [Heterodermia speciosa]